ncbi:MAG: lipoprotein-anchoring transpeptidase ErfK/SrfK [Clostridium sp.]|jgi:lipoprotein-anchoring transpeptidase ErfK/SrfK
MLKKNVFNLVIAFLLIACSWLYNDYLSNSINSSHKIEIAKIDFIAFPTKENKYKISPLIKEFTSNIAKNKIDNTKQLNTNQEMLEKSVEISNVDTILKIGSSGDKVTYIQHRLKEYGYKVDADGLFEALTYDAILNFQYRCRLEIDGSIGSKTLEKLNIPPDKNIIFNTKIAPFLNRENTTSSASINSYKSINNLELSINSLKTTSDTNYYINVDLSNQRVNIFIKSNEKWILDKSFICSSGKSSTPTVKGNFTVKDKGPMFRAGSNTICNYYTRFDGNYLFHTVLLDNNENIQDGRLGTPLSHGCIRLAIDDAKYIYTTVPYGTFVSIQ